MLNDRLVDLSRNAMLGSIPEFLELYEGRPLSNNFGGMGLNHSWALWYIVKHLAPKIIVESGVWKGHSTWIIENGAPDATIYSFDVDLSHVEYKSPNAIYTERDFTQFNWSGINTGEGLCFFDDHQNSYQRTIQSSWLGFKHIIIEDNWPINEGDCYSLRKAFAGTGAPSLQMSRKHLGFPPTRAKRFMKERSLSRIGLNQNMLIEPNSWDVANLEKRLTSYSEMPPVFLESRSQWGPKWEGNYQTVGPLLKTRPIAAADYSYSYLTHLSLK
jgi:hypothetical protein